MFDDLPGDVASLTGIVQGLVVYEDVAPAFYGVEIPAERDAEKHIRTTEALLEGILALDGRALSTRRPVERRLAGRCHHFVLLLVSLLRTKGTPARARAGFGAYFNPGYYEDHWVVEYWDRSEGRWKLADPQFDGVWLEKLGVRHDPLDVPRTQFLVAADAWRRCRSGEDPSAFGVVFTGMRGAWYVAGSLIRDLAALNKTELLPWDVWGAQPAPGDALPDGECRYFDELAALTLDPDASFEDLRRLSADDARVRVPPSVFNALRRRSEPLPL